MFLFLLAPSLYCAGDYPPRSVSRFTNGKQRTRSIVICYHGGTVISHGAQRSESINVKFWDSGSCAAVRWGAST